MGGVGEGVPEFIEVCGDFLKPLSVIVSGGGGERINTSIGEVVPVGIHRLKVVEFFAVLLTQNYEAFDLLLLELGVFTACLNMFFSNFWNNFLHALVGDMVCTFISNRRPDLTLRLLTECNLLDQICDAASENEKSLEAPKGFSRGYMGFIVNMANKLVEVSEGDESGVVGEFLKGHEGWKGFVEGVLKKHNADALIVLGGAKPSSEDLQSRFVFCFVLFCFVLFCFVLFCFVLFCFVFFFFFFFFFFFCLFVFFFVCFLFFVFCFLFCVCGFCWWWW